jgi:hypothetical protein
VFARIASVVSLATLMAGCSAWFVVSEPLPTFMEDRPERVRLTLEDDTRVTLGDPALEEDAVVGTARECGWAEGSDERMCREGRATVPTSEIDLIEVRRFSWGHTAAAGLVAVGVIAAILSQVSVSLGP